MRFISEIYTSDVCLNDLNDDLCGNLKNKINLNERRKWRTKNLCKVCRKKNKSWLVKCNNTKCKIMVHIPCAIQRNMIIPLEFMMDYYGLDSFNISKVVPFYCSNHNRDLISNYKCYLEQLKGNYGENESPNSTPLSNANTEPNSNIRRVAKNDSHDNKDDMADFNYMVLSHPEFNFNNSTEDNNDIDEDFSFSNSNTPRSSKFSNQGNQGNEKSNERENYSFTIQKPKYHKIDDPFSNYLFNASTHSSHHDCHVMPEFNFYNIENNNNFNFSNLEHETKDSVCFNKISKSFYDHFDKDISLISNENRSNITISEITQLKEFFVKILKNYKKYDNDLLSFYNKIFDNDC